MNHMEEAIDCPKIENARQKTAGAISGVRLEMLFAVVVAKVLEYRCGNHHFAQLAQKNAQANKILFGEGGVKMIGQGRNQDVKLARIQKNHPEHYMRAGKSGDYAACGAQKGREAAETMMWRQAKSPGMLHLGHILCGITSLCRALQPDSIIARAEIEDALEKCRLLA